MAREIFTGKFWADASERALKTAAQSTLGILAASKAVDQIDWEAGVTAVAVATGISLLTSIVSANVGDKGTASLVKSD